MRFRKKSLGYQKSNPDRIFALIVTWTDLSEWYRKHWKEDGLYHRIEDVKYGNIRYQIKELRGEIDGESNKRSSKN